MSASGRRYFRDRPFPYDGIVVFIGGITVDYHVDISQGGHYLGADFWLEPVQLDFAVFIPVKDFDRVVLLVERARLVSPSVSVARIVI